MRTFLEFISETSEMDHIHMNQLDASRLRHQAKADHHEKEAAKGGDKAEEHKAASKLHNEAAYAFQRAHEEHEKDEPKAWEHSIKAIELSRAATRASRKLR